MNEFANKAESYISVARHLKLIENSLYCYLVSRVASKANVSRNIYGTENLALFSDLLMKDDLDQYCE